MKYEDAIAGWTSIKIVDGRVVKIGTIWIWRL